MFYRLLVTEIFKNNARLLSKTYRDRVKELIKQHLESARVRREKMKPAKTEFYQRKLFYGNLEIFAFWDIRFVNQDNRAEDEQKIENRLKALAWKNDLKNICAVVVLITLICILTYANIHVWYHDKL
jgi:phosphodiesterase/alkaline phosphatase D-like protein